MTNKRQLMIIRIWRLFLNIMVVWIILKICLLLSDRLNYSFKNQPVITHKSKHMSKKAIPLNWKERTIKNKKKRSPLAWCFDDKKKLPNMIQPLGKLASDRPPIFFIETSCRSHSAGKIILGSRQACAIESAAKMNRNSDIYVLFISQASLNTTENTLSDRFVKQISVYSNIYFRHVDLSDITKGTMLNDWYQTYILHTSIHVQYHTSDMLRLLVLWKYGGTYLDSDIVVKTSLENLSLNYAGAQSEQSVNNAVLNFGRSGYGHLFTEKMLYNFRDSYIPSEFSSNGPAVVTRAFTQVCGTNLTAEMRRDKCEGIEVYPPNAFYPISWEKWEEYFDEENSDRIMEKIRSAKLIHIWGKLSTEKLGIVKFKSPYSRIASEFCPRIFSEILHTFLIFNDLNITNNFQVDL